MVTFIKMAQQISFCKSWFRAKKRATEMWAVERAHAAHEAKTLYTVLVGNPDAPTSFLEINDGFVGVGFLDGRLREILYYAFKEVEPGILFLSMATYRDFIGETDKVAGGTTYVFERVGRVKIRREQFVDPREIGVAESVVDVLANYSMWPKFGDYEDLIKAERVVSS